MDRWGEEKNRRKERKEGKRQETGRRVSDGLRGADGQREGGEEDQFCQIWVHTPGALQLDRPTERA